MRVAILQDIQGIEKGYVQSCEHLGLDYSLIDIYSHNWLDQVRNSGCDLFFVRPSSEKDQWKQLYDERVYIINKVLKKMIYPSYEEIYIYENKRLCSYWCDLFNIPHPQTQVFYRKADALNFLESKAYFPIVFKSNLGSAASGVVICKNKKKAISLVKKVFPYFKHRLYHDGFYRSIKLDHFGGARLKLKDQCQYNYAIFQEYIISEWEWRIIRLGDSFFGHKKLKKGDFCSGSGLVGWESPPEVILDLVKNITDKCNFRSMAVDIFEDINGKFYINEMQSLFGSYLDSQMFVNDKPGRFLYKNGKWIFEEGVFNRFGSSLLRVEDALKLYKDTKE